MSIDPSKDWANLVLYAVDKDILFNYNKLSI